MRLKMFAHPNLIDVMGQADITGITADSRAVRPGYLFAALGGAKTSGVKFIDDALARGASAVLAETQIANDLSARGVPALACANPRLALALSAAAFYARQPKYVAAITGTNGKTSVASFVRQIWQKLNKPAASLGTLGVMADGFQADLGHTTPDPVRLHEALSDLAGRGIDHLALEASSHGLDQYRLDGIFISAVAITNITRDHLDYHASFKDYVNAKMRLFAEVAGPDAAAIINMDGAETHHARAIAEQRGLRLIEVGSAGSDLRLTKLVALPQGQQMIVEAQGRRYDILLPLVGAFQASNALVAAGLVWAMGDPLETVLGALSSLDGVPGRMERAALLDNGAAVYVDYAHTPDALQTVLTALRPHTAGRLIVVFGCGGDRDRGKRPEMGAIAAQFADQIIVTDDNPRSEAPDTIRAEILAGILATGSKIPVSQIADRAQAIAQTIGLLQAGDVLAIAGKGHESGQIVGDQVIPFDDRAQARAAAARIGGVA
jgi:UDP-N-acetylmuramoyl-L-alanyl-D-glutamate--2,6-diaminopimelate ligase